MKQAEAEEQVHAAQKDVYTTVYQPQPQSHELFTNSALGLSVAAARAFLTKHLK